MATKKKENPQKAVAIWTVPCCGNISAEMNVALEQIMSARMKMTGKAMLRSDAVREAISEYIAANSNNVEVK